jgi:uncharacterized protein YdgA (DUF945 family)
MKKSAVALGVVVVLGVVYAGSSWYVGKRTQDVIEQLVAQDNKELVKMMGPDAIANGAPIVKIDDYARGVFSSDVVFSINLPGDRHDKPVVIKFSDHLLHGPLPLARLKSGNFSPVMAISHASLVATANTQPWFDALAKEDGKGGAPVTATTVIGFSGTGHSEWTIKPLNVEEDGTKVVFSGGALTIDLGNQFRDKKLDGHFGHLSISDPNGKLEIKNIKLGGNTAFTEPNKTVSHAQGTLESVMIATYDNAPMTVTNWSMAQDSTQVGDMLDGSLLYKLGDMKLGGADMGSIQVGAKASGLNMTALSTLAAQYNAQQEESGDVTPDSLRERAQARRDALKAVLASNPVIAIDPFRWETPKGKTTVRIRLQLGTPENADGIGRPETVLARALRDLTADANLSKPMIIDLVSQMMISQGRVPPQGLIENEVDRFADRMVQAGLARDEGDNVVTHVHYHDDVVDINSRTVPAADLMRQLFMLALGG